MTESIATGRLLGYARVSRQEQVLGAQMDALKAAGCDQIWQEKVSGVAQARPQLEQLLDTAAAGDVIVVWKLDRLARSTRHLLALVDDLRQRKIGLRSLTEAIDTTSAGGAFIMTVFAALAEFERGLIVERTQAGLTAARHRGRIGGRPSVITKDRQDAITQLAASGKTVSEISRAVGVSRATIYRHIPG